MIFNVLNNLQDIELSFLLFPTEDKKKITNFTNRILFNFRFQQQVNIRQILPKLAPKYTVYSCESS